MKCECGDVVYVKKSMLCKRCYMREYQRARYGYQPRQTAKFKPPRLCVCGAALEPRKQKCAACKSEGKRQRDAEHRAQYRKTERGKSVRTAQKHRRRALERDAYTDPRYPEWVAMCLSLGLCFKCGETENLTVDHVIPLSLGGTNTADNIQPLCSKCNSSKNNRSEEDYRITLVTFFSSTLDREPPICLLHQKGSNIQQKEAGLT